MTDVWNEHSYIIAAGILDDPTVFERLAYDFQLHPNEVASPWSAVYEAAMELHPKGIPLTKINLAAFSPQADKAVRTLEAKPMGEGQILLSATAVRKESSRVRKGRAIQKALQDLQNGSDPQDISAGLVSELSQEEATTMRSAKIGDIMDRIQRRGTVERRTRTGIQWIDTALGGGLRNRTFIAVGAPEKSRKTTLMRNIALYALRRLEGQAMVPRDDTAVIFMAYENDQEISTADFLAMLAAEYIFYRGLSKETHSGEPILDFCNADQAEKVLVDRNVVKPGHLRSAFSYAYDNLKALNLEIPDRSKQNGNLNSLKAMEVNKRRFAAQNKGKHIIAFVDYAQLVRVQGMSRYESLAEFAQSGLNLAAEDEGATIIAASQMSREGKRLEAAGEAGDVMSTKGGADIEEAVQAYFTTEYNPDKSVHVLQVALRRARRNQQGRKQIQDFTIHPGSGLFLRTDNGPVLGPNFKAL